MNQFSEPTDFNKIIDSASDERVNNNVVRHEYRTLSDEEKMLMKALKDHGQDFIKLINLAGKSREYSLAITKIEEAVMWAVKGLTK